MADQSTYNLLLEMNAKLGRVEARLDAAANSREHIRLELAAVRSITESNRTSINLAKGGIALATMASAFAGLLVYFVEPRTPEPAPVAPHVRNYPAPEPFHSDPEVSLYSGH